MRSCGNWDICRSSLSLLSGSYLSGTSHFPDPGGLVVVGRSLLSLAPPCSRSPNYQAQRQGLALGESHLFLSHLTILATRMEAKLLVAFISVEVSVSSTLNRCFVQLPRVAEPSWTSEAVFSFRLNTRPVKFRLSSRSNKIKVA